MTPKLIARAVVFLAVFVLVNWTIEASGLVSTNVESRVSSGEVSDVAAPKLTSVLELVVAAVAAVFVTTHAIGDKAADLLVVLWGVIKTKVLRTYEQDTHSVTTRVSVGLDPQQLIASLNELDDRIKSLEKARSGGSSSVAGYASARKRSTPKS